jgi:hypothetical protein
MKKPILLWVLAGVAIFVVVAVIVFIVGPSQPNQNNSSTSYKGVEIVPDLRKDTIPALTNPAYESGSSSLTWLKKEDRVIGVAINGDVRAYPLKIMSWHEAINETIGAENVLISYSPLCGSGAVFMRDLDGQTLTFGNTGALYESCTVFYDSESNSYWWQVNGQSIRGPNIDKKLTLASSVVTTWGEWYKANPNSQVLSVNTGHSRDYLTDPYNDYYALDNSAFPASVKDDRLPAKELVVGIEVNGKYKAYSAKQLAGSKIEDNFEGQSIEVIANADGKSAQVYFVNGSSRTIPPQTTAFWFAWSTANPQTELYAK